MALYTSKGTLTYMGDIQTGTGKSGNQWQRMEFVIELQGFQGSVTQQKFSAMNDVVGDVRNFRLGDKVIVSWSMYARAYNGKMYNNVDCVKITPDSGETMAVKSSVRPSAAPAEEGNEDLPF